MRFTCPTWPPDWPEIERSISEAVQSGDWGRYRSANHDVLRAGLADMFNCRHVRLVSSGTAAIELCLRAAGVGRGDEVVVAAFDYPGNFRSIELVEACPVLLDIDPTTFSIAPESLEAAKSPKVKAVVVSHLYGHAAPISSLRMVCDSLGWVLIEDACQSPGLKVGKTPFGALGHMGALSFGGSKPLTAGCGGAVLTNDDRLAARTNGLIDRPSDALAISSLQAAALAPQLERLAEMNQVRDRTARAIGRAACRFPSWLAHPVTNPDTTPAYYKLAFSAASRVQRDRVIGAAESFGLPIGAGFRSMHRSSVRRCRKPGDLPIAEKLGDSVFVLDHRALLIDEPQHAELIEALAALHDQTQSDPAAN
mgnify:CR=1 FL=1|tara:strand:+ start:4174 stop:5271 length:1098 start_codon:yes stop_codon:yes gene_type:complete